MKLSKSAQNAVTVFAVNYMVDELALTGRFDFGALQDRIVLQWPTGEFNWLTVVRAPMQHLLNEQMMVRDTSDLRVELYTRGPRFPVEAQALAA